MQPYRRTAIVAGVLFIIGTVAVELSGSVTNSLASASDDLTSLSAHGNQVAVGALLAMIAAFASASIALALYPVLKRYHEGLALGAVGFRLIEAVFYLIDVIGLLLLLTLSQAFVKAGSPDTAYFHTIDTVLRALRVWANFVCGVSAFSVGALLYYVVLYQARLIPRWLAGWGVLGAVGALATAVGILFGLVPYSLPMIVMILPIAVQELVLAVWLIFRGFNVSAIASRAVLKKQSPMEQ